MAVQLASAYMQIIPSMKGLQGTITKELVGVEKEGVSSGSRIGAGMSGGIRGRLLSALPNAGASIGNMFGGGLLGTIRRYAGPITGVVAGLVSVEAVKKSMETFEATAASTRTLQRVIGGSAQSVSGFVGAMQLSGVESDKAGTAMRIFSKQVGLAGEDSKKAKKLTSELGFAFQDAHGKTLPMASLLPKLADKFQAMPDGAQKTALAMQLFGKSGTQMLPFLDKGSAGIAELTGKAKSMGLVIDDTSIKIFGAARVSLREFKAAAQGAGVAAGQDFTVALDGLANIGRAALIPVFNGLAKVFSALRPQFITIGEAADRIAQKLGAQLAPIVNRLAAQFIAFVQKADIAKWSENVSGGISKVVGAIGGLSGGGAVSAINGIVRGFSPLEAILQAIRPILPQIVSALGQAATTIGPILATLATQVVSFLTPLITSRAGILLLVGAFVGFKIVSGIITAIAAAARLAAAAQIVWNIAMSANPIGIIVVAIAALVAGLVWFFTQTKVGQQIWAGFVGALANGWNQLVAGWNVVAAALANGWNQIVGGVRVAFNAVVGFLGTWGPTILAVLLPVIGIPLLIAQHWGQIVAVARTVWAAVVGAVTAYVNRVRAVITTVAAAIVAAWNRYWQLLSTGVRAVWAVIVGAVTAYVNRVRAVVTAVVTGIAALWRAQWTGIQTVIRTVWNTIVSVVTTVIGRVRAVVSAGINAVRSAVSAGMNAVLGVVRSIWNTVVSTITGAVGRAVGVVRGMGSQIVSAVGAIAGRMFSAGRSIVEGLANGIRAAVGAATGAISHVISAVTNFLPHSPAKEGPLSGKGWSLYSGHAISESLAAGMTARTGLLRSAAGDITAAAHPTLDRYRTPAVATANHSSLAVAGSGFPSTVTLIDKDGSILGHMDARIRRYDLSQQLAGAR